MLLNDGLLYCSTSTTRLVTLPCIESQWWRCYCHVSRVSGVSSCCFSAAPQLLLSCSSAAPQLLLSCSSVASQLLLLPYRASTGRSCCCAESLLRLCPQWWVPLPPSPPPPPPPPHNNAPPFVFYIARRLYYYSIPYIHLIIWTKRCMI